nr:MAG TPA: hypothetical protein [Bacteriophage sp.]
MALGILEVIIWQLIIIIMEEIYLSLNQEVRYMYPLMVIFGRMKVNTEC